MKYLCIALVIIAVLILSEQIVTEIIKSLFKNSVTNAVYNAIVVGVSLVLTLVTVIAASQLMPFALKWYIVIAAVVGSFFIAYGAMFGYDKLFKRIFDAVKNAINSYSEFENIGGNENEKK